MSWTDGRSRSRRGSSASSTSAVPGVARGYVDRSRPDGRAVPARPPWRPRIADVRDGRPRTMARRRRAGAARSSRRPGQGAGLPRRARRGRGRDRRMPGGPRGRRHRPGGRRRRPAPHRLSRRRGRSAPPCRRDPAIPPRQAPAPHDPVAIPGRGGPAADPLRQGRSSDLGGIPGRYIRRPTKDASGRATRSSESSRRSGKTCCRVRPIGVTDDFFDLGGHSLLAVRLAARIEERFGRAPALSDLLLGATIEDLAARLREPIGSQAAVIAGRTGRHRVRAGRSSSCIRSAAASSATTPWPAASTADAPSWASRPRASTMRSSPRRISCGWHPDTSRCFAPAAPRTLSPGRMVDGGHRGPRDGRSARRGGTRGLDGLPDR